MMLKINVNIRDFERAVREARKYKSDIIEVAVDTHGYLCFDCERVAKFI